eukprot:8003808-Heterocapsa_arctica.AAC.1
MLDADHPDKLAGKRGKHEEDFCSPGVLNATLRSSRLKVASTVLKPLLKVRRLGSGKGPSDSGSSNTGNRSSQSSEASTV